MRLVSKGASEQTSNPVDEPPLVADGGVPSADRLWPRLPPSDGDPARLLALSGAVVATHHQDTIDALLNALKPDVVVAVPPQATTVNAALGAGSESPVLSPARSVRPDAVGVTDGEVLVTTIPTGANTVSVSDIRKNRRDDTAGGWTEEREPHTVCLTTRVSLSVDPYQRSAVLDELADYLHQLPDNWTGSGTTHCSTALRAGYRTTTTQDGEPWSLVGIGRSEASLGVGAADDDAETATLVEVYRNGAVGVETIDPSGFGLRSLHGVGEKRAETLRQAGYRTPAEVRDASPHELAELGGLGRSTCETIQAAATAQEEGTAVATGDDALPQGDPVFVDIETDGLDPSCAWLIGVLDGDATEGNYLAFEEPEPGDGEHIEAFLNWKRANASGRPLVAWNGYNFDFPVLSDQIRRHCPAYEDVWDDIYQFDLLWWARDKDGGNVALPGRNNKLESVAEALGWDPQTTGIDGGVVARIYSAYRREYLAADNPSSVAAPDWDRLRRYCEDDVRALAVIYEALADAARRDPGTTSSRTDTGTQGALSDFT
jgi:uncharacterized protein YprB with RNaseH-like and TPR domain